MSLKHACIIFNVCRNFVCLGKSIVMYATAKDAVVVIIVLVGLIVSIYQL